MKMLLIGIGQEVSLDSLDTPKNFLLFEREDGTDFRVHVDQAAVAEVLLASKQEQPPPAGREVPEREAPIEEQATEFGGDAEGPEESDNRFLPEPEEQYASEDDVASL